MLAKFDNKLDEQKYILTISIYFLSEMKKK